MANQLILIALVLIMISAAFGSEKADTSKDWQKTLPEQFDLACGEIANKFPYDPKNRGTMIPFVTGSATRYSDEEVSGRWTGGFGYKVQISATAPELFGTSDAMKIELRCYGMEQYDSMTCFSDLKMGEVATVPGFNGFTAKLSPPIEKLISGSAEFTVRVAKELDLGKDVFRTYRYHRTTREASCQYKVK